MNLSYNEDNIVLYINNSMIDEIDFDNIDSIKEYFKTIFLKLKNTLNLEINGYYLVHIYKDNGIVIELYNEETDYYYDEIDMKILLEETTFLYQIEDIFIDKKILEKSKIIKYNKKLYLQITNELTNKELGYLFEISKLIYKNTENIIKYSREIPLNLI